MSAENQEQDFEKLQRLLKLKRHELPPPRFFNDFSGQVTARIRAGDVGKLESLTDVVSQAPWLQRLWQAIVGKPAVSGAFALAACGLLVAGIYFSDQSPSALPNFAGNENPTTEAVSPTLFATAPGMATLPGSTTPTSVLSNSLFNGMPALQAVPVSAPTPISPR
jgi:hypothetical protein